MIALGSAVLVTEQYLYERPSNGYYSLLAIFAMNG